jgi:hypothetical protein
MIRIRAEQLDTARRAAGLHDNTTDLARAMGLTPSAVGRTLAGKRAVSSDFIEGMRRAFPNLNFDHLFDVTADADDGIPA